MSYKTRFTLILITVVLLIAAFHVHVGWRRTPPQAQPSADEHHHDHAGHDHGHEH
jgi:hypothetical protein